ncbi:MAG TPA: hemolysin family protein [Salinivirgaceae bacterium]|nr:hemolysin family protein [Salinivirgaceae bacterium]HQA76188.1 hemolysin family protein [Salinivirgaceae bacterium]
MNIAYVIIVLVTIAFSAFFSGMEIAYISSSKLKIEIERKKNRYLSAIMGVFVKNPAQYIATMLIGNNIALVIYGIFIALILEPYIEIFISGDWLVMFTQTIISTIIILITGEFTPKILFRINPNRILRFFAVPGMFFYIIFYPIAKITTYISNFFLRIIAGRKSTITDATLAFDRYDLSDLLTQHQSITNNPTTSKQNVKMFRNVLDFHDITTRECIVPRNEIVAIDISDSISNLTNKFAETGFSRILVYENNIDNIIGYVHTIDMFSMPESIKSIVHPVLIVPETMPANKLLKKLIKQRKSIALVVDEFGGTDGVVTLEDVLEEIIGEIEDEHDTNQFENQKIDENKYLLSGRLEIDMLNEKYRLGFEESEQYETLAGYILYHHRNIPKQNQVITIQNYKFKIVRASGTQIITVELTIL